MEKEIMRLQFISSGFEGILKSEDTRRVVQEQTDRIKQNAVENYSAVSPDSLSKAMNPNEDPNSGFSSNVKMMGTRWVGFVTADGYASASEAEDKVLTRAIT